MEPSSSKNTTLTRSLVDTTSTKTTTSSSSSSLSSHSSVNTQTSTHPPSISTRSSSSSSSSSNSTNKSASRHSSSSSSSSSSSTPSFLPSIDPDDIQSQFKIAANALTQIYKRAYTTSKKDQQKGYLQARQEMLMWISQLSNHPLSIPSGSRIYVPLDVIFHCLTQGTTNAPGLNAFEEQPYEQPHQNQQPSYHEQSFQQSHQPHSSFSSSNSTFSHSSSVQEKPNPLRSSLFSSSTTTFGSTFPSSSSSTTSSSSSSSSMMPMMMDYEDMSPTVPSSNASTFSFGFQPSLSPTTARKLEGFRKRIREG